MIYIFFVTNYIFSSEAVGKINLYKCKKILIGPFLG